ncbi:MAG: histidine ammonia-lyase [Bacteroidetes bacterium]|jgi:histidine ammonia-lyase|nr:histidine ammonia-lyase [Bacteroidota bacterium]
MYHSIDPKKKLSLEDVRNILDKNLKLKLSDGAVKEINKCRAYLDKKLKSHKEPIYGINTGFGSLYNVAIPADQIEKLQENLVMSHACGMGEEVPTEVVRLMLFLKIQAFSYGKSACHIETVERLIFFYNNSIFPVIYQLGSLGASGDLSPLAHMSLPLLGMGEVYYQGIKQDTEKVYKQLKLSPLKLRSKEGLALLNGTQFMSAYGIYCLIRSERLNQVADTVACVSLESFDGRIDPFKNHLHTIRPHNGQIETALFFRETLKGSALIERKKAHVQDPYSFRCIPQVHGATKDTTGYVKRVFETEINSVTDNPTVFPAEDEILSGGNFHGQPLALALDFLAIAMAELGNISERRTYQLISGLRGLPPFLVSNPGLNSGMMIPQYTAASIVSQNKQLCTPASVDSIVSSNGQEDHVSMGANAATKCYQVVRNVERVIAIEMLNASQAIEFRRPLKSSAKLEKFIKKFRSTIPVIKEDKILYQEMEAALQFVKEVKVD